jgi:hypothetical protein
MVKDLLRAPQMTTHGRWRRIGRFRRGSSQGGVCCKRSEPLPCPAARAASWSVLRSVWLAIAVGCASSVPGVLEGCSRFDSANIVRVRSGGSRPTITSCLTRHLDRRSREPDSVNGYDQRSSVVAAIPLLTVACVAEGYVTQRLGMLPVEVKALNGISRDGAKKAHRFRFSPPLRGKLAELWYLRSRAGIVLAAT